MKTKARVLSLLLAMLMIVSLTPAVAEEPITIKVDVQSFASPQMLPKLDEYVAEFEKENNINVELTVSVSDDAYRVKLLQDIAAGNQADVCFVDGSWLPEFVAIDALVPLNKWMSDEMKDKFMEYGIAGSTFGDDIVSIWFHTGSSALYYRKDLLAEAGYLCRLWLLAVSFQGQKSGHECAAGYSHAAGCYFDDSALFHAQPAASAQQPSGVDPGLHLHEHPLLGVDSQNVLRLHPVLSG